MKNLFLLLISNTLLILNCFAAQLGCYYWVRTNGHWGQSQTAWGQTCSERTWEYPDGTPIPKADIICCDFDKDGNYLGTGINCDKSIFQVGSRRIETGSEPPNGGGQKVVKERNELYGTLHGNWYFAP